MNLSRLSLLPAALLLTGTASAHEILLEPQCRQGTCNHVAIRNIAPVKFSGAGTLVKYTSSFVEARCKSDEAMDDADCRTVRPDRAAFRNFTASYAFCSTARPLIASRAVPEAPGLIVNFLDPAGEVAQYQVAATLEYLVVCHGWEPTSWDSSFSRYVSALGYTARKPVQAQVNFASEAKFLQSIDVNFKEADQAKGTIPPQGNSEGGAEYVAKYWRGDDGGIFDTGRREYVLRKQEAAASMRRLKGVTWTPEVTMKNTSGQPLQIRYHVRQDQSKLFRIDVDFDERGGKTVEKSQGSIAITDARIADRAGIRVGDYLNKIPGYNWRRNCRASEGMWTCYSSYSQSVWYEFPEAGQIADKSIDATVSRFPVAVIHID